MRELTEIYEELHGLTNVDMQSRVKEELRWYRLLRIKVLTGRPGPNRPDLGPRVKELERLDNGLTTGDLQGGSEEENRLFKELLRTVKTNN
jgi:hypothetical protein